VFCTLPSLLAVESRRTTVRSSRRTVTMMRFPTFLSACFLGCACVCPLAAQSPAEIIADPLSLVLSGPNSRQHLLIHEKLPDGSLVDQTRSATYTPLNAKTVSVASNGLVRGLSDGQTTIRVEARGRVLTVPVKVTGVAQIRSYHFENDIVPLLGRFGCNSSGCHGKAEGQNGFKLSVFGFDPAADYVALLKEARGRRVMPSAPERSLILTKPSGQVAHGGGLRIPANSEAYEMLRGWIAAGAPMGDANAPRVESIRIEPPERVLALHSSQQLRVMARYTDGRNIDVTTLARFQTNNDVVAVVGSDGWVQSTDVPGEAAIMAAFMNEVASFRVMVPRVKSGEFPKLKVNNFIDTLVDAKLKKLNINPSEGIDDYTFIRRVFLDIIGTLPTPDETRKFIKDAAADKRAKLVDALLDRSEYADLWALKWSDLLRVERGTLGHKRAYAYYRWIRESFETNKGFDSFVRELLTAEGPIDEVPAANFYRVANKPGDAANSITQVFMGIRIACAECHHHPYDRWGQDDYFRMSAFFSPISMSKVAGVDALMANADSLARNPRTGQSLTASPLGVRVPSFSASVHLLGVKQLASDGKGDQRRLLAEWLVSPRNPWFARNLVNRNWSEFFGRGIVDPVDDVRATNPPSNPELLDALAKHFDDINYDLKKLIKTIVLSRTYQTSSKPNDTNMKDEQNFSRSLFRKPDGEVVHDMITQTLGVPEKFEGMPLGTRAIQLWDNKVKNYFLKTLGRPSRTTVCECERASEPNLSAVLHVLNSDNLSAKLQHENGMVARFARQFNDDEALIEEMYLLFFSRPPRAEEKPPVLDYLKKIGAGNRRRAIEDIAWAFVNTKEFMFNR
jgi:Protein of unknown function (DUF1549)/Protein of unknown function (DUF1553)